MMGEQGIKDKRNDDYSKNSKIKKKKQKKYGKKKIQKMSKFEGKKENMKGHVFQLKVKVDHPSNFPKPKNNQ